MSKWLGRLQFWLQGCGPDYAPRPWPLWRLGNGISALRYWAWRARGGTHEEAGYRENPLYQSWLAESNLGAFYEFDLSDNTSSTNSSYRIEVKP